VHQAALANASSIAAAGGQSGGKDKAQWMAVELMGMFTGMHGALNGIKPRSHVLDLRVAEDYQTEFDARDRIEFILK
jgi:hypothetical protein